MTSECVELTDSRVKFVEKDEQKNSWAIKDRLISAVFLNNNYLN